MGSHRAVGGHPTFHRPTVFYFAGVNGHSQCTRRAACRARAELCRNQRRNIMNRRNVLSTSAMALLGLALASGYALGQTAKDLVGTWSWVSVEITRPDGTKYQAFGANPKGFVIFDSNGRFAYLLTRPDRAKFAANNREQGTPEENKASVLGVLAYSGRYSISDGGKTLIFHIEASS